MDTNDTEPNTLELSVRFFSNELIGLTIKANNFTNRWFAITMIGFVTVMATVGTFGPDILNMITQVS